MSRLRQSAKLAAGLLAGIILGLALGSAYGLYRLWMELPEVDHLARYEPSLPLRIFDRDGILLAEYGEERREFVPVERIPLMVRQALLAIEDARYYDHGAVDFVGLLRAAVDNIASGGRGQGASTITMQVARVFFLSREKTYTRKLKEILLAYKLESVYSKDKLLELYMNQIYLGERAYGFAAAASVYFGKTLDELTVAQAAMLAGLPKAPSAYNPIVNPARAAMRQHYILQRMRDLGYIDAATHERAQSEILVLRPQSKSVVPAAAYAVERARQLVFQQYGEDAYVLGLDVVMTVSIKEQMAAAKTLRNGLLLAQEQAGYVGPESRRRNLPAKPDKDEIRTALAPYADSGELRAALVLDTSHPQRISAVLRDSTQVLIPRKDLKHGYAAALRPAAPAKQRIDRGSVIRVLGDKRQGWRLSQLPRMQGALVSLDVETGEILALVGGFDYALNKFDHATQALRQPGSTFKPFVFSAALEKGYFPGTLVDDMERTVVPAARGRRAWRPRNNGDNYEGRITARRGLARSKNTVAVSLMEAAGADFVQQFATRFGFDPDLNPPRLPLALGAGAITPFQLTLAYAVFANSGVMVQPRLISEVSERDGKVLYSANKHPLLRERIISARNAYVMDSMLKDVINHGTARRAATLGRSDLAGKTGTSNNARDAWFAGYSSGIASTVWIGYDQPRSLGRATGGTLALPIWTEYMQSALSGRHELAREMPSDLAVMGDDYIYAEYLNGQCIEDLSSYVHSALECAQSETTRRPRTANPLRQEPTDMLAEGRAAPIYYGNASQ